MDESYTHPFTPEVKAIPFRFLGNESKIDSNYNMAYITISA